LEAKSLTREEAVDKIEQTAGHFPVQMLLVQNLFDFSFAPYQQILQRSFATNSELISVFESLEETIQASDYEENAKQDVIGLLREESEIIAFSKTARSSVIAM